MYVWNSQCHGTTLTERGGSGDIYIYIYISSRSRSPSRSSCQTDAKRGIVSMDDLLPMYVFVLHSWSQCRLCYQMYLTLACVWCGFYLTQLPGCWFERTHFKYFICLACSVLAQGVLYNRVERGFGQQAIPSFLIR